MVDSTAMTDLSGTNPTAISIGVWAVSTFLAGLTGVLAAPIIGLDADQLHAAHRRVVRRRHRRRSSGACRSPSGSALLMGVATSLIQRYLPPASAWTSEIIDAVPFIVIAIVLIYNLVRRGRVGETEAWGGRAGPGHHAAGREQAGGVDVHRGRDRLPQLLRQVRRARCVLVAAGRRPAARPRRLLGGADGPGLRLRRDLPVVDAGHRRRGHALALPDHLRRGRSADHGPVRQPPRLAGPGRRGRRGARRHGDWAPSSAS